MPACDSRAGGRTAGPSLACALAAAILACTAGCAAADVLIGVAVPLSGARSGEGREFASGVEAAAAALNANGGIGGQKITIEAVDDGCNGAKAATAAAGLIAKSASLVIGHPCPAAAIAAARVYAKAPLTFIALGVRHPDLTDRRAGANVYRLAGRDVRQGAPAAAWIAAKGGGARVAVIHDRTLLARTIAADFIASLARHGIGAPPVHGIVAGEKDYGVVIAKLVAQGADTVYFAGFPAEAIVLLRQIAAAGLKATFMGPESLATPELSSAGADHLARVILTAPDPGARAADLARAGVEAWAATAAASLSQAGANPPAALTGPYQTTIGTLTFDAKGDASIRSFRLMRWSGGAWTPLEAAN